MLISTDNGARGFNLEEAAFVIHYDLPYNTLKLEQRIDRCHRLGQENDVLSLAFINKHNLSDVRKLELASKRTLVSDGVFGITDHVLGGFTGDLKTGLREVEGLRTRVQVEADFQDTLVRNEEENRRAVSAAEDVLFTTFTRELANRVNLSPRYVSKRAEELNDALWGLAKSFFLRYNDRNTDCVFVIDEERRTVTATQYESLPVLFYYWTGSRNRPYRSQKRYGMGAGFKPKAGQITFTSVIGQGILRETACADSGTLTVEGAAEPCRIGLYTVVLSSGSTRREFPVLCGVTDNGRPLGEDECKALLALPAVECTEDNAPSPHWLKGRGQPHELDKLVPVGALLEREAATLDPAQAEELERMKLRVNGQKAALARKLDGLETQVKALEAERDSITGDRLKRLRLEKQVTQLRRELLRGRESQFFDTMRLDLELEEQVKKFAEQEKLTAKITREFVLEVIAGAMQ